jgi:hypothetical protein
MSGFSRDIISNNILDNAINNSSNRIITNTTSSSNNYS